MEQNIISMEQKIADNITGTVKIIDTSGLSFTDVREYAGLVSDNVWTKAIQTALDEKKNVYIPYFGHEILIDGSIFMDSGTNLKADPRQVIRLKSHSNVCMLRNRNMLPGGHMYIEQSDPDEYITVEGGIWSAPDNERLEMDAFGSFRGGFAMIAFSNANYVNIRNLVCSQGKSYAVLICNCNNFCVDGIGFDRYDKDGIHVNGPSRYGIIRNLNGVGLGDDMVALLAWDWFSSCFTYGDIQDVLVENIEGGGNEFRMLAGRKIYPNGKRHDGDLRRIVFRNITGVYTYKMYYQPYYLNAKYGKGFDSAETVGRIDEIYFENISIPGVREIGFNDLIPVLGLFDIMSDCRGLHFSNINVDMPLDELERKGVSLINVGPISATFKYTDDMSNWADFFEPDRCCTVEDIHIENAVFHGEKVTDAGKLVKETKQSINSDYPKTLPAGGTGSGKVEKIFIS